MFHKPSGSQVCHSLKKFRRGQVKKAQIGDKFKPTDDLQVSLEEECLQTFFT
jgi:hypothetical protein